MFNFNKFFSFFSFNGGFIGIPIIIRLHNLVNPPFLIMKNIINLKFYLIAILLSAIVFSSCNEEDNGVPFTPIDEINSAESNLYPDKESKIVSTILTFQDLSNIDYILVSMSGGGVYSDRIESNELTNNYHFTYKIRESDPENFTLLLRAIYKDGNTSNPLSLSIDNRWGFFIREVKRIARVTGSPMMGETLLNPNNTALDWNVGGTDLGIIWEMQPGQYGVFFGDTFGRDFSPNYENPGPNGSSWRSNVLAFSTDNNLEDGLTLNSMVTDDRGDAKEIVQSAKSETDITSIPTAAIRANGSDYVHYFNMRNWDTWTTNYSGMYKSDNNGQTWIKLNDINFKPDSPFGQVGYFKKDGYIYMIGTQTGRSSTASLARFKEADIENINQYEYWNGTTETWEKGNENLATTIIDDEVGELSFIYNIKLNKWIIAYFNGPRYNITMRTAENITGPWSEPYELASGSEYAQLYGSYFHPKSVESEVLYFTMSMWLPYNVFLMKVVLADMGTF